MPESVYLVVLHRALQQAGGDLNKLAEVLGVGVETLSAWLREEGEPTPVQLRSALNYIAGR